MPRPRVIAVTQTDMVPAYYPHKAYMVGKHPSGHTQDSHYDSHNLPVLLSTKLPFPWTVWPVKAWTAPVPFMLMQQIQFPPAISSPYLSRPHLDCAWPLSACGNSHSPLCVCSAAACRRTLASQKAWVPDLKTKGMCVNLTNTDFLIFQRPTHSPIG